MKKLLLIPILALLALAPIPTKAVKQLIDKDGIGRCTAWSYKPQVWITANHCTVHQDTLKLEVIKRDAVNDFAAVKGDKAPTLRIALTPPTYLDKLVIVGYPGNQPAIYAMPTDVVAFTREVVEGMTLDFVVVKDSGIGGMSGSPVLNQDGEVVGILHAAGDYEGVNLVGVSTLKNLREFLKGL